MRVCVCVRVHVCVVCVCVHVRVCVMLFHPDGNISGTCIATGFIFALCFHGSSANFLFHDIIKIVSQDIMI